MDRVTDAEENGMYCIIDSHILDDRNPFDNITTARTFFQKMSNKYKNKRHVIYEICNEPNGGTSWSTIKSYAEQIIPIIRANDPEGIILVGSPEWSSRPDLAAQNPLTGSNAYNVMYTFHFYANTHYWHDRIKNVADEIPLFASEWGTVDASGNGGFNSGNSNTWVGIMNGNNQGGQKISHCNWAYNDKNEATSLLNTTACDRKDWTDRTSQTGNYIFNLLSTGDNFSSCSAAGDDDGDGIINGEDNCAGTAPDTFVDEFGCPAMQDDADNDGVIDAIDVCPGTMAGVNVNKNGCQIANEFESNVCLGFNNFQNYVRTDFSYDPLENLLFWNKKGVPPLSSVYEAEVINEELVITCTNADPTFKAQGFSFGQNSEGNDVTADISAFKKLKMDVRFDETSTYAPTTVLLGIQIEDADGHVINADQSQNDLRVSVAKGQWRRDLEFDFTDGVELVWDAETGCAPCANTTFDFTRVAKIIMFCNPGAGESWSRPVGFTGTWKIDNFSFGYDETDIRPCDSERDEDNDGVRIEEDSCRGTLNGFSVDVNGCATYQLDDDEDGVSNADDICPGTTQGLSVNSVGCDEANADEDSDGVIDVDDVCPLTPLGIDVSDDGCNIVTIVNSKQNNSDFKLFPNPTNTIVNIEGNVKEWVLMEVVGNEVVTGFNNQVDMSSLASGVYYIQVNEISYKVLKN